MKVRGQDVLRWPSASVEDFKARPMLSGIPFLGPWANRLDQQAFYANGRKYAFDMELGNVRGAIPIHGCLSTTDLWEGIEVNPDATPLRDHNLDDVFGDLVRDGEGRAVVSVAGKRQRLDIMVGPTFRSVVVWAPRSADFICLEPMAGITDAVNLAHQGV